MNANQPSDSAGAIRPAKTELEHEIRYAIEVLQKEFPERSPEVIARSVSTARQKAGPSADRWQVLAHARNQLSNR